MPAPKRLPKYRHYRPKNLAVVRIDGRDIYLGRYDSPESHEKYHRVLAEWMSAGVAPAPAPQGGAAGAVSASLTVSEVVAAFWKHAQGYYRRADGTPTGEIANYRRTLRPLRRLYGSTPAVEFGPKSLKAVRQSMVDDGMSRKVINQRIRRIVHVFGWAVENELIPGTVHHALKAVRGLQWGRSGAKETEPVKPVPDARVDAIEPHVARQVWAMVQLQRLTGARPGEITAMRSCDLETSGSIWSFHPLDHKTAHHGHDRVIYLGPQAQEIVKGWLRPDDPDAFLFSPQDAMRELWAARRAARKTPMTPSQRARRRKKSPDRAPKERYTTHSYYYAIRRACAKAGIPPFHPHQIRHTAATRLRKEFGLDAARVILGHSSPAVTEVYADLDREKALSVVGQVG